MDLHVDLRGRRALVTGGATGIGRAISEAFMDNGAAVAVGYRSSAAAAAELTARASSAPVAAIAADLTDAQQVEHLCTEAAARLDGPIDILVNNAGDVLDMRPLLEGAAVRLARHPGARPHRGNADQPPAGSGHARARLGQDHQRILDLRPHRRGRRGPPPTWPPRAACRR